MTQEMKEDSKDIYVPSKVEESKEGRKRKKNEISKYESEHVADGSKEEFGNVSPDGASEINTNNFETEPPPKKIRLSSSRNNKSNQNESMELIDENQNEEEAEFEINYENLNANFFSEELSPDDEIFTFQCPKSFDVKCLLNKSLDLSKYTKLKDNFNKYICQTLNYEEKKIVDCIFPSKEMGAVILKIPIVGHIIFRQILKAPKNKVGWLPDHNSEIVQPADFQTVKRHPLLGTDWDDHFNKVRIHMKRHKKILKKSLKHEKSLELCEKERKEKKKKLKVELALLKKKQIMDSNYL